MKSIRTGDTQTKFLGTAGVQTSEAQPSSDAKSHAEKQEASQVKDTFIVVANGAFAVPIARPNPSTPCRVAPGIPQPIRVGQFYIQMAVGINQSAMNGWESGPRPGDYPPLELFEEGKTAHYNRLSFSSAAVIRYLRGFYDESDLPINMIAFQQRLSNAINAWRFQNDIFLIRPDLIETVLPRDWPFLLISASGSAHRYYS